MTARDICDPCKKGVHGDAECLGSCQCHCNHRSVPYVRKVREPEWRYPDLNDVFAQLRAAGVQCRASSDSRILWRPTPAEMPLELRQVVKRYGTWLAVALIPWKNVSQPQPRKWWTSGAAGGCVGCGRGCVVYDGLGQCRHLWCGWIRQTLPTR